MNSKNEKKTVIPLVKKPTLPEKKPEKLELDFLPIQPFCPFCTVCHNKKEIAYNCDLLFPEDTEFCINCLEKGIEKEAVLTVRDHYDQKIQKRVILRVRKDKEDIKNTKLKEAAKVGKAQETKKVNKITKTKKAKKTKKAELTK